MTGRLARVASWCRWGVVAVQTGLLGLAVWVLVVDHARDSATAIATGGLLISILMFASVPPSTQYKTHGRVIDMALRFTGVLVIIGGALAALAAGPLVAVLCVPTGLAMYAAGRSR